MRADGGKEVKKMLGASPFSGGHDIHAGGVAKPAQDLFTVLPCQTERPHVGHPPGARPHRECR